MKTHIVAVYGTLKRDKYYAHQFKDAKFIKEDTLENGQLHIHKFEYTHVPWPMLTDGKNDVTVEVFEVPDALFQSQKAGEEANGYETREVTLKSGTKAFMWFYKEADLKVWQPVEKY